MILEGDVNFEVVFKGIRLFSGNLDAVEGFVARQWGSSETASEIGVKVVPILLMAGRRR